jgi:hypothetical protein
MPSSIIPDEGAGGLCAKGNLWWASSSVLALVI